MVLARDLVLLAAVGLIGCGESPKPAPNLSGLLPAKGIKDLASADADQPHEKTGKREAKRVRMRVRAARPDGGAAIRVKDLQCGYVVPPGSIAPDAGVTILLDRLADRPDDEIQLAGSPTLSYTLTDTSALFSLGKIGGEIGGGGNRCFYVQRDGLYTLWILGLVD